MIKLPDEMKRRLSSALMDGSPAIVGYVDTTGGPHLSFYGSLHALDDDRLGLWARRRDGELVQALARDPRIAVMYSDMRNRIFCRMYGRGRVVEDEAERNLVYEGQPQFEKDRDPEREGAAIIVELDSVVGRGEDLEVFRQERDA